MLKRIKETLTCTDSGRKRKSRIMYQPKLQSHLLHSDESTYFYKYNSKVRSLLYSNKISTIPLVLSAFGLLLVLGLMISPSINRVELTNKAYAEEGISTQADGMSVKLELKDPQVDTLTTQAETGKVNYISKGFTVTTANVDGYNVYVQTAPGASNKLQNGSITIDFVKTEDTAPANFTDNSWGYKVDATGTVPENLTYSPVPEATATNLNPAYSSKSTGETRDFTLNFAAKFASDATPGHYGTDVILSVAAGAYEVTVEFPKWTISNMQDMNSTICANAKENTTGQLTDLRDGKQYWVTKLKDGNCWMTQNLDFDLKQGQALTPELSDVQTDWTPGEGEGTMPSSTVIPDAPWLDVNNSVRSYDPGEYVNIQPLAVDSICGEVSKFEECASYGWVDVDGNAVASDSPNFGGGIEYGSNGIRYYNGHYSVGNYYSWAAATAGQGLEFDNNATYPVQATDSICPKGWSLPRNGRDENNKPLAVDKTYAYLLQQYGWSWDSFVESVSWDGYFASYAQQGEYNILAAPFYFPRAGRVGEGGVQDVGQSSFNRTATSGSYSSTYSFYMHVNSGGAAIIPSGEGWRGFGYSIRCVAD